MLDIHTHILPEMDDGSKSRKQSLMMLRREAKQGVQRIVYTPHFYADREAPESFLKRRNKSFLMMEEEVAERELIPERMAGAEVAYFGGISRSTEVEELCIGDTRAMLIEMPFCRWNRTVLEEIEFLWKYKGIRPIIAHVERYIDYQPRGMARQLCEAGIWIQANASFFEGWRSAWTAMRMLKAGEIHFIGSDCHDTKRRPPNMGLAISTIDRRLGKSALMHLECMEQRLLEGGVR